MQKNVYSLSLATTMIQLLMYVGTASYITGNELKQIEGVKVNLCPKMVKERNQHLPTITDLEANAVLDLIQK